MSHPARPVSILLAEDNAGDVILARLALERSGLSHELTVASDGEIALDILHQTGKYANTRLPDIVLLDINMPRKNGTQVLEEMKADEQLRVIPAIMLTGSSAKQDITQAYARFASGYIVKPLGMSAYDEVVKAIEDFWFGAVTLPSYQ